MKKLGVFSRQLSHP